MSRNGPADGRSSRHGVRRHRAEPGLGRQTGTGDGEVLTELIAVWNRLGASTDLERRLAEDEEPGSEALVRVLAALDLGARRTGGTLAHATGGAQAAGPGTSCVRHLLELLHHAGLRAATTAARQVDAQTRAQAWAVLRSYWQAPLTILATPLHDSQVMLRRGPFLT